MHTQTKKAKQRFLEACFPLSLKAGQERTSLVYMKHAKHPAKSKDESLCLAPVPSWSCMR